MRDLRLSERRSLLGASAVLWAGATGVKVGPDRWIALSGGPTVEYNAALVHGDGDAVDATVDEVLAAGAPAVVMLAGPALAEADRLEARRWIRIGAMALMELSLDDYAGVGPSPPARQLGSDDYDSVKRLIGDVFGVGPRLAGVAISGATGGLAGHSLWGAFDSAGTLVSCLAAVRLGDTVAIWSMATIGWARRRGYGAAALDAALSQATTDGAASSLLSSSPAGEPLYRALGYRELERWQQWSRPRWVLART